MSDLSKSKTLKWYDWFGHGKHPKNVKGIKRRDGYAYIEPQLSKQIADINNEDWWEWHMGGDVYKHDQDIIAYTLGEPLTIASFLDDPSENKKLFNDSKHFADVTNQFDPKPEQGECNKVIKQLKWELPRPLKGGE